MTGTVPQHCFDLRLHAPEDAKDIHTAHVLHLLRREVGKLPKIGGDACIVHSRVELAISCKYLFVERLDLVFDTDICFNESCIATLFFYVFDNLYSL